MPKAIVIKRKVDETVKTEKIAKSEAKTKSNQKKVAVVKSVINFAKDLWNVTVNKITAISLEGSLSIPLNLKEGETIDNGHKTKVTSLLCNFSHDYEKDYTAFKMWRFDLLTPELETKIWKRLRAISRQKIQEVRKAEREKAKAEKPAKKVVAKTKVDAKNTVAKATKKVVVRKK